MKLGYLLNTYPITSTTFIRREIEAHERAGMRVERFAVRPWGQPLVDPDDVSETGRVIYLLDGRYLPFVWGFFREILGNPVGFFRAIGTTVRLMLAARKRRLVNVAYFFEAVRLKGLVVQREISHLHVHFSTNAAAVALLVRRLGGPTYSITVHGPDELYELEHNAIALKMRHASFFAVISEYCRRVVAEAIDDRDKNRLHIVRCGVVLENFTPTNVPDTQTLVCIGRLVPAKAQDLLVKAIGRIALRYPGVRVTLIGDGELRPQIESLIAELELDEHIELIGWQANSEVRARLKAARFLVLPSYAEGLPVAIMESFMLGRPVVSTKITGIPELVTAECGWLAEPGDVDSLAAALESVLETPVDRLTQMGQNGRTRVEQMHDQDKTAADLRALFKAL